MKTNGLEDVRYQQEMARKYCRDPNCGTAICASLREEAAAPVKLERHKLFTKDLNQIGAATTESKELAIRGKPFPEVIQPRPFRCHCNILFKASQEYMTHACEAHLSVRHLEDEHPPMYECNWRLKFPNIQAIGEDVKDAHGHAPSEEECVEESGRRAAIKDDEGGDGEMKKEGS